MDSSSGGDTTPRMTAVGGSQNRRWSTENTHLLSAIAMTGSAQALVIALRVVRSKAMAVYLGTAGVGVYSQTIAFVETVVLLSLVGMPIGIASVISHYRGANNIEGIATAVWSTLKLGLVIAILVTAAIFAFAPEVSYLVLADAQYEPLIRVAVLATPFLILMRLALAYFDSHRNVRGRSTLDILYAFFGAAVLVPLAALWRLPGAVASYVVVALFTALASWWLLRRHFPLMFAFSRAHVFRTFRWQAAGAVLSYGFISLLMANGDRLVLLFLRRSILETFGATINGLLQSAQVISGMSLAIALAFHSSYAFPRVGELQSETNVNREVNRTIRFTVLIMTAVAGNIVLWREPILLILFSRDFVAAGEMLAIQSLGDFFYGLGLATGIAVVHRATRSSWFLVSALRALAFFAFYHLLLSRLGVLTLNSAYLLSAVVYTVASYVIMRDATQFQYTRRNIRLIVLSALTLLGLVVFKVVFGGLLYYGSGLLLLAIWLAAVLSRDEVVTFLSWLWLTAARWWQLWRRS